MDSLVFLVALSVAVAVIGWFITNELSGASGDRGWLAIRAEADAAGAADKAAPPARYRIRARLTPGGSSAARCPAPRRAYRVKAASTPRHDGETVSATSLGEDC